MSRFRETLDVIPKPVWLVAVLCYVAFIAMVHFIFVPSDGRAREKPTPLILASRKRLRATIARGPPHGTPVVVSRDDEEATSHEA